MCIHAGSSVLCCWFVISSFLITIPLNIIFVNYVGGIIPATWCHPDDFGLQQTQHETQRDDWLVFSGSQQQWGWGACPLEWYARKSRRASVPLACTSGNLMCCHVTFSWKFFLHPTSRFMGHLSAHPVYCVLMLRGFLRSLCHEGMSLVTTILSRTSPCVLYNTTNWYLLLSQHSIFHIWTCSL